MSIPTEAIEAAMSAADGLGRDGNNSWSDAAIMRAALSAAAPAIQAAALTEAGTVEWGVEREGEVIGYYDERHARLSAAASVLHGNSARVVSRRTLPWTAVQ